MPPTRAVINCNTVKRYDTLVSKATQYGAKLLKKTDQIPAVYVPPFPQCIIVTTNVRSYRCSHLFWNAQCSFQDGKRTMDCLRRSGKIAENVFQSQSTSGIANVGFYLQILERYLYVLHRSHSENM
jgi:hypothetical protein